MVVTKNDLCPCSALLNTNDCGNMPGCAWQASDNTCTQGVCSQLYQNSTSCLQASQYCQWSPSKLGGSCQTFTGCDSITATSSSDCIKANAQCISYNGTQCVEKNLIASQCVNYDSTICQNNYGTDGLCQWNAANLTCGPINSCSQLNSTTCEQVNIEKGQLCYLNGGVCTQISNCNQLTTCTYYFSNFTTLSINLCQLNGTNCVPVSDTQQLGSTNCLKSTGYTHRWLSSFSNPNFGICASCQKRKLPQINLFSQEPCQCSQYIYSGDCATSSFCQWNNGVCSQIPCTGSTIDVCVQLPTCYWNYNKQTPGCESLGTNGCSTLPYKFNGVSCAAQSLYCAGFNSTTSSCVTVNNMGQCGQATEKNQCQTYIASNGFCLWLNNACVPLTQCNQITDPVYCSNWQSYCKWSAKSQSCVPQQCNLLGQQQCKYVFTNFYETQQQLCKWNGNACENSYSAASLNATTCVQQTGNFYRWTSVSPYTGFCATCAASQQTIQTSMSCQCSQFQEETACNQSGYCTYTGSSCQPFLCTQIPDPTICASNTKCFWNPTLTAAPYCQPFPTSCSGLPPPNNQLECFQMSTQCKGITQGTSGPVCASSPTQTCAQIYSSSQNKYCENFIGMDGVCFLQGTNTQTCQGFNTCSSATKQSTCLLNKFSCTWTPKNIQDPNPTAGTCSQLSCASFTNPQACLFYFPSLLSTTPVPCMWNTKTSTCVIASDVMTQLTETTCSANTFNTFRWLQVTNSTTQKTTGYCIKCQQQLQMPSQCGCTQLTSQENCQSLFQCAWVNGVCTQLTCSQIYMQSVCASTDTCSWTNNLCQPFSGNCAILTGSTQLSCISQNIQCVGVSANGKCNNVLSNCEQNVTPQTCIDQKGSNGICYWNNANGQCQAAITCNQLTETACKLRQKACYWEPTTGSSGCYPLTCSQQYSLYSECTFITELLSVDRVQSCQLNNSVCVEVVEDESLSQTDCFTNTNGLSRWVSTKKGKSGGICLQCAKTMVPIQNSQTCQCTQLMTQQECYDSPLNCVWNTSTTTGGNCTAQSCSAITSAKQCAATLGCAYTPQAAGSTTPGSCGNFASCSSVNVKGLTNASIVCLQYSVKCQGNNGANCTEFPAAACSTYTPTTTPADGATNICNDNIGTDGPCYYNAKATPPACVGLSSCSQITEQKYCNFYKNLCTYTPASGTGTTGSCGPVSCATFKTPATCTYYVTSFVTGEIKQCQWSQNQCGDFITAQSLTEATCAANSAFTYRWAVQSIGGQTYGYCTKCSINQIYSPGQCSCNQILTKDECNLNQLCLWTATAPGSCYNKPCSQINSQYYCSINPRCSWSKANGFCQPFSSCSELSGVNQYECASYSVYCAGSPTPSHTIANTYICSPTSTQTCALTPTSTTSPQTCENTIVSKGICMYTSASGSGTDATAATCTLINSCSQITSQQRCELYPHSCSWGIATGATTATCNVATCTNLNKLNCSYVLGALNSPTSKVTQCEWQAANGCVSVTGNAPLTEANCYTNSFMMSRWAASLNSCVSCQQNQLVLSINSPCKCSSLDQADCNQAAPRCEWSTSGSGSCVDQTCSAITAQYKCSLVASCIWTATGCASFSSNCNLITTAANALACVSASINCPVYTAGSATPCSAAQSCSKYTTQPTCAGYNGQLAMPQCSWTSTGKCVTITNCGLIQDVAECGLQTNRCVWSAVLNSCITQTCSSYTSPATCHYIYTSFAPGDVSFCQWNSNTQDCRSVPLETVVDSYASTNATDCFINSGHTYHWDGTDCSQCFEKILAILSIVVLLIAL